MEAREAEVVWEAEWATQGAMEAAMERAATTMARKGGESVREGGAMAMAMKKRRLLLLRQGDEGEDEDQVRESLWSRKVDRIDRRPPLGHAGTRPCMAPLLPSPHSTLKLTLNP